MPNAMTNAGWRIASTGTSASRPKLPARITPATVIVGDAWGIAARMPPTMPFPRAARQMPATRKML